MDETTMRVREPILDRLFDRKRRGERNDDVLERLLDLADAVDAHPAIEIDAFLEGGDVQDEQFEQRPDVDEAENIDELVAGLDLPGQGTMLEERRAAVRAVLDHLRREGRTHRQDLQEVAVEIAGGTYSSADSLWKNCIQPALGDLDVAESEGPSGHWRWVAT